jgi:signal transduction histidine kinase
MRLYLEQVVILAVATAGKIGSREQGMQVRSVLIDVVNAMSQPGWRAAAIAMAIVMLGLIVATTHHMHIRTTGRPAKLRRAVPVGGVHAGDFFDQTRRKLRVNSNYQHIDFQEALGLLHMTLEALNARTAILDCYGNVIEANDGWRKFMREFQAPVEPMPPTVLTAEKLQLPLGRPASTSILAAVVAVIDGARDKYSVAYRAREKDRDKVYEFSVAHIEAHGTVHILVSHEDVTDVREAAVAIRELSKHVTEIEEDERQRIAGELHDVTGQHLIAISLNLMNLRREMKTPEKMERLIEDIERSTEEAQREIRLLSYLLYPPQLEQDGAKETIEHYVEGFARRAGLRVRQTVADEIDTLPLELQRSVLRVIQEAMANVHRHASATSVTLKVTADPNSLYLEVQDDGRGMQQTQLGTGKSGLGVGIPGMKARVGQFNGVLRIESSNRGTVLRVRIPMAGVRPAHGRRTANVRVLH